MMPRLLPLLVLLLAHAPHAAAVGTWKTAALPELLRATALVESAERQNEWHQADFDASLWALFALEQPATSAESFVHDRASEPTGSLPTPSEPQDRQLPILQTSSRFRDGP